MIVRIAENQKERDARRQMLLLQQVCNLNNNNSQSMSTVGNCVVQNPNMFSGLTNSLFNVNYLNGLNSLAYASLTNNVNSLTSTISANNQFDSSQLNNSDQKTHPVQNPACSTITSVQHSSLANETAASLNKSPINQSADSINSNQFGQQSAQLAHLVNLKNLFGIDQNQPNPVYPFSVGQPASYLNATDNNLMKPLSNLQSTIQTNKQPNYNATNLFQNILPSLTSAAIKNHLNNSLSSTLNSPLNNQAQFLNSADNNYSLLTGSKIKTPPLINFHQQNVPNQMNLLLNTANVNNKKRQLEGPEGANL